MSKTIIILIISTALFNSSLIGQPRAGGFQPPDFDAEKAAGIVIYDYEKVVKKLKVKDETKAKDIAQAIYEYNIKMDEMVMENGVTLQNLEDEFQRNVQIAIQNRDRSKMNGVKNEIQQTIPPIRMKTNQEQEKLDEAMKSILDEKQFDKWVKYQKSQRSSEFERQIN
ncbi:MAG: hypothetical protein AAF363_21240 [Bacteroidota bacterium]